MTIERLNFNELYVSRVEPSPVSLKESSAEAILYVHGGPGFHSAYFEQAIQELAEYQSAPWSWICYDQRGCGRSDAGNVAITHEQNIEDLAELIRTLQANTIFKGKLRAVMGHSYGGWLVHQTLKKHADIVLPAVIVATAPDMRTARNHSMVLDMLELRMDRPDEYNQLLAEFGEINGPIWNFQARIRTANIALPRRPLFLWGNLEVKAWYEQLKQRVAIAENWELTRKISNEASSNLWTMSISAADLSGGLLWICGLHDLLMGYDQYLPGDNSEVVAFLKSGHYPQFEEPKRFLSELSTFLNKAAKRT